MRIFLTAIYIVLITLTSCKKEQLSLDYNSAVTTEKQNHVFVEFLKNTASDNILFTEDKFYRYRYKFLKDGKEGLASMTSDRKPKKEVQGYNSKLFQSNDTIEDLVQYVQFSGKDMNNLNESIGWQQSAFLIEFLDRDRVVIAHEQTGLSENYKNLWMHPIRSGKFMDNYTAPWPFVKWPIKKGDTYKWQFSFDGKSWQNTILDEWQSVEKFNYGYQVKDIIDIDFQGAHYRSALITATGKSNIGNNYAEFIFSPELGFYSISLVNLDSSQFEIKLVDILRD